MENFQTTLGDRIGVPQAQGDSPEVEHFPITNKDQVPSYGAPPPGVETESEEGAEGRLQRWVVS